MGILKLKKNKFYCHNSLVFQRDLNTEKALVSNKISTGEKYYKYFIGYLYNDHKVKPLHIMLLKTSVMTDKLYVENFKIMLKKKNFYVKI